MVPWLRNLGKEFLQTLYLRDKFLWRIPAGLPNAIGLTFDDGPDPLHTPAILELLSRHDVKATFFLVGCNVERYPHLAHEIIAQGHALGGHTHNHRTIVKLPRHELVDELERCRRAIQNATGVDTDLFRPPKGEMDFVSARLVAQLGYKLVHWSKTYSDYKCDGTKYLLQRINDNPVRNRDILLFHDTNPYTVEALSGVIPKWRNCGFSFYHL
jgi:peptidoglycan/xylan/chitin deacetylase (PgdA/CDA1 family)